MRLWKCRLSPTAVGVATLLMVNAGLIAVMSWNNSPTLDEPGHLAAGISYWQTARFDVYRVNPPLVRLVAAAPAALAGWELDWSGYSDTPGQRPEWQMGSDFIKLHGADALRCIRWARWACIPLSLLGAFVCYTWARQLYGAGAGWLALTLWTFAPNILAYGALITPDAAAAAMGVWAAYEFWRWLEAPRAESAFAAGLVLGLTQLSKMTWIILYPLWPCLWLAARRYGAGSWCREALQLAMIVLLSVLVLHLGYAFEDPCWQLKDYRFVSSTLTGIDPDHRAPYGGANRFENSWLGRVYVPLPRNYVEGLDLQRRDFEHKHQSYLLGQWHNGGWWYYYLAAWLVKAPLGTWCLLMLAIVWQVMPPASSPGAVKPSRWRADVVLLGHALAVLVLVSAHTSMNRYLRYVLPMAPLMIVWISQAATDARRPWQKALVGSCVAWSVLSSLVVFPHSLSYFNELAGGPRHGHAWLVDANIDWGQDLLYLHSWLDRHPEARPLYLAYFGSFCPGDIGLQYEVPDTSQSASRSDPAKELPPGWYAISVNFLRGYESSIIDQRGQSHGVRRDQFAPFLAREPVAMAGYSIYIYEVKEPKGVDR